MVEKSNGNNRMKIDIIHSKTIMTKASGFLASKPYPFTHTISAYNGCGFGNSACGSFCYAASLPNWRFGMGETGVEWGEGVVVKENAAELLDHHLRSMTPAKRSLIRIFMSSTTDPYQPLEAKHRLTRQLLNVFKQYNDLDLLVIQTRSPLAQEDFDLIAQIPYALLSVTVETDDQKLLHSIRPGGPAISARLSMLRKARKRNIPTQVCISPCLPHSSGFFQTLIDLDASRYIVDTLTEGDGAMGQRTAQSPFAPIAEGLGIEWRNTDSAHRLYKRLVIWRGDKNVGWSNAGFCGVPPRDKTSQLNFFPPQEQGT